MIAVTQMEHHSNLVPWQMLAQERGATLADVAIDDDGRLDLDSLDEVLAAGRSCSPSRTSPTSSRRSTRSRRSPAAPRRRRGRHGRRRAGRAAPAGRRRRARRRLLRLDRPQGLRPDRRRRPARAPRAARGDAAVARRRAHDQARRRPGVHLRRAARALRGGDLRRSPRRSASAPPSTSCRRSGWTRCARTGARSPATRSSACARCPASPSTGPPDVDVRGSVDRLQPRRRAPARRLRDPRPRGRLHPRRPPLHAAADAPPRRRRDVARELRGALHARGRRPPDRRARLGPGGFG